MMERERTTDLRERRELVDMGDLYANDVKDLPYLNENIQDPTGQGDPSLGLNINQLNNYSYDELGNLIKDRNEGIDAIDWTVTGKVRSVERTTASGKPDVRFTYDAGGNRIIKQVGDPDDPMEPTGYREHYVRDAQGNIMAIYRHQMVPVTEPSPGHEASLKVTDRPIYGSSRVGTDAYEVELGGDPPYNELEDPIGLVKYELTDHLGNVAAVVTDELLGVDVGGGPEYEYFQPHLISAALREPFGLDLTGMNWQSDASRFGFQSQIKDLELGFIHYKYREYGPDGSGFLTIDPLAAEYPHNSPYAFSENRVIDGIELEGLEHYSNKYLISKNSDGKPKLELMHEAKQAYPGKGGWGIDARFYTKDAQGTVHEIPEIRAFIPQEPPLFHLSWGDGGPLFVGGSEWSFTSSRAFEGKHGFDNGGKQAMLGTAGIILGGGSMYAAGRATFTGILGLLGSADDLTGGDNGTLMEQVFGEKGTQLFKVGSSAVNFSTGLRTLVRDAATGKNSDTFFIDFMNVLNDEFDLLLEFESPSNDSKE